VLTLVISAAWIAAGAQQNRPAKVAIAHRGASGYAPEHTVPAYTLAMEQKVDFVEPDLAVTKDNVLVCLHDDTLERTTNVAEIYPDRASPNVPSRAGAPPARRWLANDFTLAELRRLDAGKWFKPEFAGTRIPTFQEMIDVVRRQPGMGIYPELKSPPLYKSRGIDQVKLFVEAIRKNGLDKPEALKAMPVIIQSFDEETVRRVAVELPMIPRAFLTSKDEDVTDARLREIATFATGIAPEKVVIARNPGMVKRAHDAGLTVTSWTFKADEQTAYPTVRDEMAHFLYTLGIDALFTNHPDQFPRR
jgi:glycerophosphoryl diester phosphodiesterase